MTDGSPKIPIIPPVALARAMYNALSHVADTGYVPWETIEDRACTEEMQKRSFVEFEAQDDWFQRRVGSPRRRAGRYYLTVAGRDILAALHADMRRSNVN